MSHPLPFLPPHTLSLPSLLYSSSSPSSPPRPHHQKEVINGMFSSPFLPPRITLITLMHRNYWWKLLPFVSTLLFFTLFRHLRPSLCITYIYSLFAFLSSPHSLIIFVRMSLLQPLLIFIYLSSFLRAFFSTFFSSVPSIILLQFLSMIVIYFFSSFLFFLGSLVSSRFPYCFSFLLFFPLISFILSSCSSLVTFASSCCSLFLCFLTLFNVSLS